MPGRDRRAREHERMIKLRRSLGQLTGEQARDQIQEVREREGADSLDRLRAAVDKCGQPAHDCRADVGLSAWLSGGGD